MSDSIRSSNGDSTPIPEITPVVTEDSVGRAVLNLDGNPERLELGGTEEDCHIVEEEAIFLANNIYDTVNDFHNPLYIDFRPTRIMRSGVIEANNATRLGEVVRILSHQVDEYRGLKINEVNRRRAQFPGFINGLVSVETQGENGANEIVTTTRRGLVDPNRVIKTLMRSLGRTRDPLWQVLTSMKKEFPKMSETEMNSLQRLALGSLKFPALKEIYDRKIEELKKADEDKAK